MPPPRMRARPGPLRVVAATAIAVLSLGVAWLHPHVEGDTVTLLGSAARIRECLASGESPCRGVSAYSLQQTLVAMAGLQGGLSPLDTALALALVSGASIAGLACLMITAVPVERRGLGLAMIASSPLLYYARSTFGEALAAVLLTAFVVTWRRTGVRSGIPWRVGVVAALAALGKDTFPGLVVALGGAAAWIDWLERRPGLGWRLAAAAAGAAFGALAFAGLHQFRLGTPYNAEYLDAPEFFLHGARDIASAFAGHWLSPSAGLLWFWPLAGGILATSGRAGLGASAAVVAYAAGLSLWWSPFGWVAWGDRLLYPAVCAGCTLCLMARDAPFLRVPRLVWALVALSTLATCAVLVDNAVLARFVAADAQFPGPPTIQADVDLYRAFLRHLTWQRLLDVRLMAAALATPLGLAGIAVQATVAWALWRGAIADRPPAT